MKLSFSTSEISGLRKRIRHRLDKRSGLLAPKEFAFLQQMDDWLKRSTSMSDKQSRWLLAILERTA